MLFFIINLDCLWGTSASVFKIKSKMFWTLWSGKDFLDTENKKSGWPHRYFSQKKRLAATDSMTLLSHVVYVRIPGGRQPHRGQTQDWDIYRLGRSSNLFFDLINLLEQTRWSQWNARLWIPSEYIRFSGVSQSPNAFDLQSTLSVADWQQQGRLNVCER